MKKSKMTYCDFKNRDKFLKSQYCQISYNVRDSIAVSIRGCGPLDPGSIPGLGPLFYKYLILIDILSMSNL